jgi:hypothetical protein
MTNREQIVALRGKYISKPMYVYGNLTVMMVGYEHYPEASGYYIEKNSAPITDIFYDVPDLLEADWDDDEAMEKQFSLNLEFRMYEKDHQNW